MGLGAWDQCGGLGGSCASYFCSDGPFPRSAGRSSGALSDVAALQVEPTSQHLTAPALSQLLRLLHHSLGCNTQRRHQCAAGHSCRRLNEWYYQCTPDSSQGSGTGDGSPTATLAIWQQCGGAGGDCGSYGTCSDSPYPGQICPAGAPLCLACHAANGW